jgi:acetyl esterase/lipase
MPSLRSRLVNAVLRVTVKRDLDRRPLTVGHLGEVRARLERLAGRVRTPAGVRFERDTLAGVPLDRVVAPGPRLDDRVLLYLHGGGYAVGSSCVYRPATWRLAQAAGATVVVPDYRLAPEHPYPAAPDDALAVYRALLEGGHGPHRLAVAGDSAGGNLVLVLLQRIRAEGLPMPASATCLSPWADLTGSGTSVRLNARRDPMLPARRLREAAELYAPERDHRDPLISPLFAEFTGFPPLSVYAGSTEILVDDAVRVADRARAAGVPTRLVIAKRQAHVYPLFAALVPEARDALAEIGRFVLQRWVRSAEAAAGATGSADQAAA